jgi:tetratricopeptide (TPR) repeat protein
MNFSGRAGKLPCDAPKEKSMKRTISLWLSLSAAAGLLVIAALPALAQTPVPMGKIHGHVTNPTGAPQAGGNVSLVAVTKASGPGLTDKNDTKGTFPVDKNGDYSGTVPAGMYTVVYRTEGMADDKVSDKIEDVRVVVGQDTAQDVDMSRKEYIDTLPPDQKKQLEDLRKHNSEAMKANEVIKNLNADLKTIAKDIADADGAKAAAAAELGAGATKANLDAKEAEIKAAKYGEIETLMLKDTALRPGESILWVDLGQAQVGLKKYDDAVTNLKKALDLEANSKKPNLAAQGMANSELGEVYARTGKVDDAEAAYDLAAKVDPPQAFSFLSNEAKIYFQTAQSSGDAKVIQAQIDTVDKALATNPDPKNPNTALLYYLKGQGLISAPGGVQEDPKTHKLVPPPGSLEAFQKYLDLAPTGQFATDVKGILAGFSQTVDTTFSAKKKK